MATTFSWTDYWTVTLVMPATTGSVTASGTTVSFSMPSHTIKWNRDKGARYEKLDVWKKTNTTAYVKHLVYAKSASVAAGTAITRSAQTITVNTSSLFTSANNTTRTAYMYVGYNDTYCPDGGMDHFLLYNSEGDICECSPPSARTFFTETITLNAPPTFTASDISKSGYTADYYAGLTTASVTISSATAQYGGTISSSKFTIGTQTVSGTGNGTLSILLSTAGTFTPTVSVTDSRGQTTTQTLPAITVNAYVKPSLTLGVFRSDNKGKRADEGSYGLITAKFNYTDAVATLTAPTVKIDGNTVSNVTWYSSWSSSSGIDTTSAFSNWSTVANGDTVYGLINGSFNVNNSYVVTVSVTDSMGLTSTPISQTLSTAFYTIDVKAGGKEIVFGAPANDDLTNVDGNDYSNYGLFKCRMHTLFEQDVNTNGDVNADNVNVNTALSLGGQALVDFVVEQGTTDGWDWRKWNSGKYEAEKYINYGTVTANSGLATIEGTTKLYATPAIPIDNPTPPHTLVSGRVVYDYIGNGQGYSFVFRTTNGKIQLGRLATNEFSFTNVEMVWRVVNGKWK